MYGGSKIFIGGDHTGVTDNGRMKPITGIRFITGDESEIFIGDESGTVLEQECPHATMAMAEAAFQRLKGYEYQMATVDEAGLDPAAEPGDGITAGGTYLSISRVSDDGGGFPSVEAPGEAELEEEYPTHGDGPLTRYLKTEIRGAYTVIERTDKSIRLHVEDVEKGLRTTIEETADGIKTTITDTKNELSATITETASGIRKEFQAADKDLGDRTTTIEETIDGITVSGENGTTYIKPGAIQANSITGGMIAANTITADDIQAGSITASCLSFAVYDQSQTNAQITSQINALKDGLELTVQNNTDNTAATLRLMDGEIELDAANINLTGLVTVNALQTSGGGVTINGDNITAGTIKGNYIDGKNLNIADKFVVDGSGNITIKNCNITLQDSSVQSSMIQDSAVGSDEIASAAVTSTKIAYKAVTAEKIDARGLSIGPEGGPAQFEVDQLGNVTIGGSVKIGGSISWSQVTGTSGLTNDINTAKTDANTAKTDLEALAKGNYTKAGKTFINGKEIYSPTIYTNDLKIFPDATTQTGSLTLYGYDYGSNVAQFVIEYDSKKSWDIQLGADSYPIRCTGYTSISTNTEAHPIKFENTLVNIDDSAYLVSEGVNYFTGTVYLKGTVDFTDAISVKGLDKWVKVDNVTAKFG